MISSLSTSLLQKEAEIERKRHMSVLSTYVSFAVSNLNICTVSVLLDEARNMESGLKANE